MKKLLLSTVLIAFSILGYADNSSFFLSSEKIVQEKQGSLKNLSSFVFFPLLKIEKKEASQIIELIEQELKKVGAVIKQPVLTPEGADLTTFSNPTLQFTIEQLVDENHNPLPVLQAILSIKTGVELGKSEEFSIVNTNRWSTYLKKTDDLQKVIKTTLPQLLKQFLSDFESVNTSSHKPTFYISYDVSWWNTFVQK